MRSHYCTQCEKKVTADDIALFRKLICRNAERYMCISCLSDELGFPRKKLDDLVDYYHRTGLCSLFPKYDDIKTV